MDAQRAASALGIPYYVWDFSARFKEDVVDDFVAEYHRSDAEPLHAVQRADQVRRAAREGARPRFDAVCTGHYASIVTGPDGSRELHRRRRGRRTSRTCSAC